MGAAPRLVRAAGRLLPRSGLHAAHRNRAGRTGTGISSRPRSITASFRDRCCASGKGRGGCRCFQRQPTRRSWCTARADDPSNVDALPRKARRSCRRMACDGSLSCPNPPASVFTIRMSRRGDLNRGTYTGQAGQCISSQRTTRAYDREVFLVLKEFAPSFSRGGDMRWTSSPAVHQGIAAN